MTFIKGQIPWNKGKKGVMPEPWNKGGGCYTPEMIKKMSESHRGKPGNFGKNKKKFPISWFIKQRARIGIKSGNWKGGVSKDVHSPNCPKYKKWRKAVFTRDDFTCRIGGKDCDTYVEAHHIYPWRDYPELRYRVNNGITLCRAHHPRKRAEEKALVPFFLELVANQKNYY